MRTPFEIDAQEDRNVYVKPIRVEDLPTDVQEQADGLETLFAVHDSEGQQLAIVADERMAFVLAREHNYAPHLVH
ncbi:MAG: DUF1150 family protein [Paracoccaceae bacterium]